MLTNGRYGLMTDAKEESNKFANPMFTIWALSTNMAIGASNVLERAVVHMVGKGNKRAAKIVQMAEGYGHT